MGTIPPLPKCVYLEPASGEERTFQHNGSCGWNVPEKPSVGLNNHSYYKGEMHKHHETSLYMWKTFPCPLMKIWCVCDA